MLDLDDQLSTLVRRWEADAPAISITEVTNRARAVSAEAGSETVDDHVDRYIPVTPLPDRPGRQWKAVAMLGAAAALVLIGLVALVYGGSDQEPVRPGIDTVAPQPSASPVPSTSTPTSTTSNTTPGTTTPATTVPEPIVVPTYADPTTEQLATIQSMTAASLTSFDTLRATSTWQTLTQQDGTVVDDRLMVNTVTLASNGSMWTTGTTLEWSSYDSTTGIGRTQAIGDDGIRLYTQYSFSTLPLPVVIGLDPTPHFAELGSDAEINEVDWEGRPVWEITSTHDSTDSAGVVTHTEETLDIDKATGLVIGRAITSTTAGTLTVQSATLTDLELNVAFPPAGFPGSFPSDAKVQGVVGPSGFHLLTVDEAATVLGGGLVVPSPLPATARIFAETALNQPPVVGQPPDFSQPVHQVITFQFPQGFAPLSVTVFKDVDAETATSSSDTGASVVTAGPFKGATSELRLGVLTIDDGIVTVIIRASSDARAIEVANSLVTVV